MVSTQGISLLKLRDFYAPVSAKGISRLKNQWKKTQR